jgi:hypothetical protein
MPMECFIIGCLGEVTASCCSEQKILGLITLPLIARIFIRRSQFDPANINPNGIRIEAVVDRYYMDGILHASAQHRCVTDALSRK